jgi:hypothetical protein
MRNERHAPQPIMCTCTRDNREPRGRGRIADKIISNFKFCLELPVLLHASCCMPVYCGYIVLYNIAQCHNTAQAKRGGGGSPACACCFFGGGHN